MFVKSIQTSQTQDTLISRACSHGHCGDSFRLTTGGKLQVSVSEHFHFLRKLNRNKQRKSNKKQFCLNTTSYKIHLNGFFTIMSNSFKNYFSKKSQADLRIYFSNLYISLFKFAENTFQLKMNHLNKWFFS